MLEALGFLVCPILITYLFLAFPTGCLDNHSVGAISRQRREGENFSVKEIRNDARGRQIALVPSLPIRHLRNVML